jgi:hypothetical protein
LRAGGVVQAVCEVSNLSTTKKKKKMSITIPTKGLWIPGVQSERAQEEGRTRNMSRGYPLFHEGERHYEHHHHYATTSLLFHKHVLCASCSVI